MGQSQEINLTKMANILSLLRDIADQRQEHFVVLSIDNANRLITKRLVFIGTVTSVFAHPREIYAGAVEDLATSIIVAHNHPSGDPTPSEQDIATTKQLAAAGEILGVRLMDHVIVARQHHYSFSSNGMIADKLYE